MSIQTLVVDDEPNVRLSYRMALETEGYVITEASSGTKALELLNSRAFDLALLDVRMPEMDGLELLAKMRELNNATPVIMITAHGDVPHAVRAMKLGAIDFLKKPLTPVELREIANAVVKRHEKVKTPTPEEPDTNSQDLHASCLAEAKRLLNLREFGPARKELGRAMTLDPLSAEAFNLAGVLFEMLGDHERARKYYDQAVKLDKTYEPALQNTRRLFELNP